MKSVIIIFMSVNNKVVLYLVIRVALVSDLKQLKVAILFFLIRRKMVASLNSKET